jgi:DNA helicase-2/ATP-dependent DNA helicase PcrA
MKEYKLKGYRSLKKDNYLIDYSKELNPRQLEAVESAEGPALVIAGAGTGKTKTLIYRVARLVEENIKPRNILLLTFTRKAAENMLKRASMLLDDRCGKVAGGTFHSFSNMLLRKYSKFIGFQENFTILDDSDSESAVGIIRSGLGYNKTDKRFPLKSTITGVISRSINKNTDISEILNTDYPHFAHWSEEIKLIQLEYQAYKKEKQMMDYDDLLLYTEKLLKDNDELRKKISSYYRYIMVDEFQDTNRIQANIAYLLADEHKNIMVVGDDSQSIYSFRGADFRNIMDFPKVFPRCRIITLEQNYRSTQPILNLTNSIIENSKEKFSKKLFTKKESSDKPVYIETQSPNIQSKFIVQRILELREEGIELKDMAVLFRNAWHSDDLEIELGAADIPFIKFGGIRFTEASHIKDLIAYLKISYNSSDTISWFRILQFLKGIGEKTASEITGRMSADDKNFEFLKKIVVENTNTGSNDLKDFSYGKKDIDLGKKKYISEKGRIVYKKKYCMELYKLYKMLSSLKQKNLLPYDQLKIISDYYYPIFKEKYDDYNKREKDIESLFYIAQRYKKLGDFLSDFTIEPVKESQIGASLENKDEDRLTLSTIHSAKGLEWHTVFVIYMVDGYLPSTMSMGSPEELEEERRLLYVALTRAKENLYLIKPNNSRRGGNYFEASYSSFSELTRFLREKDIIDLYTEKWVLTE